VSAHAGQVKVPTARANSPKINVPKGNSSTYKKPGIALGDGSVRINKPVKKPSYPAKPTQFSVGPLPRSSVASAHAGQVREPNVQLNVSKTRMPNPPPPTAGRGGSSGRAASLGLGVVPASHSRPQLKPLVRAPTAAVVRTPH
jgi:hypothetical protein